MTILVAFWLLPSSESLLQLNSSFNELLSNDSSLKNKLHITLGVMEIEETELHSLGPKLLHSLKNSLNIPISLKLERLEIVDNGYFRTIALILDESEQLDVNNCSRNINGFRPIPTHAHVSLRYLNKSMLDDEDKILESFKTKYCLMDTTKKLKFNDIMVVYPNKGDWLDTNSWTQLELKL